MKRLAPVLTLLLVALCAGGWWWTKRPEPVAEPELPEVEEGDTGYSRQVTEDRMRAIGYVQ